jgi:hypothetical protein
MAGAWAGAFAAGLGVALLALFRAAFLVAAFGIVKCKIQIGGLGGPHSSNPLDAEDLKPFKPGGQFRGLPNVYVITARDILPLILSHVLLLGERCQGS